ncbi:MAG TPA: hypothetical protein V6D37_03305 [Candidatus Sericytochromatia bacterium]
MLLKTLIQLNFASVVQFAIASWTFTVASLGWWLHMVASCQCFSSEIGTMRDHLIK